MQREGLELCDETLLNVCEMGDLGSLAHLLSKDHVGFIRVLLTHTRMKQPSPSAMKRL